MPNWQSEVGNRRPDCSTESGCSKFPMAKVNENRTSRIFSVPVPSYPDTTAGHRQSIAVQEWLRATQSAILIDQKKQLAICCALIYFNRLYSAPKFPNLFSAMQKTSSRRRRLAGLDPGAKHSWSSKAKSRSPRALLFLVTGAELAAGGGVFAAAFASYCYMRTGVGDHLFKLCNRLG